MLTLHYHPLSSYCWKVLIALYESGTPFETAMVNFGDPAAREAFEALWPTAKIPLLQDGDQVIPETSIQIEHLDLHHPGAARMLPGTPAEQLDIRLWDRVFDNYVMTPMGNYIAQVLRPEAERDAAAMKAAQAGLTKAYRLIETKMGDGPWAAGEAFTLADCAAAPALFYARIVQDFSEASPRLEAYFERLMARPSVARAIREARPVFQYYPLRDKLPARFLAD